MTIIRKTDMAVHIEKLEQHYGELRRILDGKEPNPNTWDQYSSDPDEYKKVFTDINMIELNYAIGSCKSALTELAKLKIQTAPRRASNK